MKDSFWVGGTKTILEPSITLTNDLTRALASVGLTEIHSLSFDSFWGDASGLLLVHLPTSVGLRKTTDKKTSGYILPVLPNERVTICFLKKKKHGIVGLQTFWTVTTMWMWIKSHWHLMLPKLQLHQPAPWSSPCQRNESVVSESLTRSFTMLCLC